MTAANETEAPPLSAEEMREILATIRKGIPLTPTREARVLATAACLEREMNQIASGRETITDLVIDSHVRARRKGWWDDCMIPVPAADGMSEILREFVLDKIPEKLALIHSEVSEALEDYREGATATNLDAKGKPCGFPSELADICIRVFDLAGALEIDLEKEITLKAQFNETRPVRHGGKKC